MMRHFLSILLWLGMSGVASAQTQLTQYQPGVTSDGAVYFLPKTAVGLSVLVEKTTYEPGDFARYAQRYLRLNDVSLEPSTTYRLVGVEIVPLGVPDSTKAFAVKFNAKTAASNVALSDEGLLLAINAEPQEQDRHVPFVAMKKQPLPNPRQFMTEEIVAAGSTAKMAELTAREIYDLRENRNLLIKGQADFMPSDGAQMQLMLNQLDLQNRSLTQLFEGVTQRDTTEHFIVIVPQRPVKEQVAFRLSKLLGMVDVDDYAGTPYYINIENISSLPAADEGGKGKKRKIDEKGIYVNVPGRMRAVVFGAGGQPLAVADMPSAQFGYVELLSGDLFDKHFTTHLWLNPVSGSVERLEAEQPR